MLRKNIYKWHRTASLIIALPVVLWAASGFMHPLMTNIRPAIATQFLRPVPVDKSKLKTNLGDALQKNGIATFHNFRLVHIDTNWFYQVRQTPEQTPVYLSAETGRKLNNGDRLYARYIAKQFLEGYPGDEKTKDSSAGLPGTTSYYLSDNVVAASTPTYDCCDAATACILLDKKGSKVTEATLVTAFDKEYKFINRLLPVYRINFDRSDGIRVYVETTGDRFAYAVDNKRAFFDKIFALFHTWEWMDGLGNAKYFLMIALVSLAFLTTLAGLYIFFTTKAKKPNGNELLKARRNHRWVSLTVSLFTLMFTFSGGYHALEKFKPDTTDQFYSKQRANAGQADINILQLESIVKKPVTNAGIVQINNKWYWQVSAAGAPRNDLMKDRSASGPAVTYVNVLDSSVLQGGDKQYALYLASLFSGHAVGDSRSAELVTKFTDEYGFVNKRLPVWRINYTSNNNERYYVETSSGKLAARVDDKDLYEGYSFAFFHKHHFMDWGGKTVRDLSTMFWALAQIAMVTVGLVLWRRKVQNSKVKNKN